MPKDIPSFCTLLPNAEPPLNPPPPNAILANVIPRILNILFTSLFCFPLSLQPIQFPLLDFLSLLQALLLVLLARLLHVHPVDLDEAVHALDRVAGKLLACREQIGVDRFGDEVEVPCGYC